MIRRTLAALAVTALGLLAFATPAHADDDPAPAVVEAPAVVVIETIPAPTPTVTGPVNPCALPTGLPTISDEVKAPTLTRQRMPKLPVQCFVVFVDNCDGSIAVTLLNPITHIVIKYRISGFDTTHSIAFGETETFTVDGPSVRVFADDDDGEEQITIARHRWHQPEGCTTPSPSASPLPTPSEPAGNPDVLPVTGQSLSTEILVAELAGGAALLIIGVLALRFVLKRRRTA